MRGLPTTFTTAVDMLALAGLAMLSVSLWTARVALTAQRRRLSAAAMAAVEATVFAVAFSRLLTGLDNPLGVAAYAAGVAAGTAIALMMDDVLNPPLVKLDIVAPTGHDSLRDALHGRGWPTTSATGHGLDGEVTVISVTTDAARVPALTREVADSGTGAFWTVTPVHQARPVPVPAGFIQTAVAHRRWPPGRLGGH